jgi:predicted metallo-beta-lactamase superfamily hydrolase
VINNILYIITLTGDVVIIDIHLMHDSSFEDLSKDVRERNSLIKTVAEYLGVHNCPLDINRDKLRQNGGDEIGKSWKAQ